MEDGKVLLPGKWIAGHLAKIIESGSMYSKYM
jgi:hypothetical protein